MVLMDMVHNIDVYDVFIVGNLVNTISKKMVNYISLAVILDDNKDMVVVDLVAKEDNLVFVDKKVGIVHLVL